MWKAKRVCVVVPAFNEARLLPETLCGIPPWVDDIVVVDDASTDGTSRAASQVSDARVRVQRHAVNQGVGAAIRTGYLLGSSLGAEVLVVMAADNQMDPADLPALLAPVVNGEADYAKGNRFLHPAWRDMPRLRRWGSLVLSGLTRWATGYPVSDCQCGYTALTTATAQKVAWEELWPRYGYPNDLLALLARVGARVTDVPVKPVYGSETSGLHPGHVITIAARILRRALRERGDRGSKGSRPSALGR